jgi:protein-disulfide isomerase
MMRTDVSMLGRGTRGAIGYLRVQALAVLASVSLSALGACAKDGAAKTKSEAPAKSAAESGIPTVLATIGDEKIGLDDLRDRVGDQLDQLDMQYRLARDKLVGTALDSVVRNRLLQAEAKKTGKTTDQLLLAEMPGGPDPSDVEISAWYNDNQARVGGRTLDQVRSQIADYLRTERRAEAGQKLEQRLRSAYRVTMAFEPYRIPFSNAGAPTLGSKDAPVTLVEFSDFQCPYCRAAAPTLKQVAQKFGDKVQIVYRQSPIASIHPFAFKAAEASLCAHDQGKFWELHDALFQDQSKLAVSDLKATARRLGIDGKKFDACLDAGRYVEQVQNDLKEAQRVGANGTPAIFINGTYVEGGSVPFSVLESLIEKELARANQPKPKT